MRRDGTTALLTSALVVPLTLAPAVSRAGEPTSPATIDAPGATASPRVTTDVEGPSPTPAAAAAESPAPADPEPKRGRGMMIAGIVLTGAALPLFVVGAYLVSLPDRPQFGVVEYGPNFQGGIFMTLGVVGLGVGVPLLAVGASRFSKHRQWQRRQPTLAPRTGRTAHGTWTLGFSLRF